MRRIRPLVAFFGHHKGATDWTNSILAQVCLELKLRFAVVHYPEMFDGDLNAYVVRNKVDVLSFDNAEREFVQDLADCRAFHVIRDPRDITVSAYYSHLYSHGTKNPMWAEQRRVLRGLSKREGLLFEMKSRNEQFRAMHDWDYGRPNVMEVRMETMTQNPYKCLMNVFGFLGLVDDAALGVKNRLKHCAYSGLRRIERSWELDIPMAPKRLPAERFLGILWQHEFSKRSAGRESGQEDVRSHYRKGMPGDWKNHFEDVHYAYFHQHYQHVLTKLGYEQDSRWARAGAKDSVLSDLDRAAEVKVR